MKRRLQDKDFLPLTAAEIAKYRRLGQKLNYFEKECFLLGLDPAHFVRVETLDIAWYHEPMEFINKGEKVLPPRRKISGANVDE